MKQPILLILRMVLLERRTGRPNAQGPESGKKEIDEAKKVLERLQESRNSKTFW